MRAVLKNLLSGTYIEVHSSTDSPDSSYGLPCWVDDDGNSYGQCQFGAPVGFELVKFIKEVENEKDDHRS